MYNNKSIDIIVLRKGDVAGVKVEKIKYNGHKLFNNLEIDFKDFNGDILNTIVIIGENGAGKTTLLKNIYDAFKIDEHGYKEVGDDNVELTPDLYTVTVKLEDNEYGILHLDRYSSRVDYDAKYPKIIYMPTEINFENINKVDNTLNFTSTFRNIIDQNITQNIPSFIATKINKEIFKNRDKTIGEVIDKVCHDINGIFSVMDLDVKLVGLSETNETKPVFRNSLGNEFNITGLSSGEKQLFLRALSLKFLEVNNSVVLIDEPEISLHPNWQRKIIDVYESIGKNNQLIIATHSPHIIGKIESKGLRVIKKDKDGIKLMDNSDLNETYGKNIGDILSTTMRMDSLRNEILLVN